jgi:hypothetical protein
MAAQEVAAWRLRKIAGKYLHGNRDSYLLSGDLLKSRNRDGLSSLARARLDGNPGS